MDSNFFDTEEKQKQAIGLFVSLKEHPGWKLFVQIVEANMEVLTHRLETEEFETTDQMKAVQRTRQAYDDCKSTPDMIIENFSRDNSEQDPGVDPFPSIEQFRADLRKARKA